jgi:hypothetical protein
MAMLALADIPYVKWLRFMVPLFFDVDGCIGCFFGGRSGLSDELRGRGGEFDLLIYALSCNPTRFFT